MENIMRGALVGIALGGFGAMVVTANQLAWNTFLHFNYLAIETAWGMARGPFEQKEREQRQLAEAKQRLAELKQRQAEAKLWLAEDSDEY